MTDVLIVGGGVIGLTCAWELAQRGIRVTVLDQKEMGREASWAGAGMIPPGDLVHPAIHQLAVLSSKQWPDLSDRLHVATGLDNEFRICQGILIPEEHEFETELNAWRSRDVRVEILNSEQLHGLVPELNPKFTKGLLLPDQARVRNPRHMKALIAACESAGVRLLEHHQVTGWNASNGRIESVITNHGPLNADEYVITAGAWTDLVIEPLEVKLNIRPMRGQIVLLKAPSMLFSQTIERGTRYLVPRDDGRILIGATVEDVGFVKENTDAAIKDLTSFAQSIIPALSDLPCEKTWAGFRPYRDGAVPVIGRPKQWNNLVLATGHYRAGLSNSPGTATVVRQIIMNETTEIDLSSFQCE